MNQPRTSVEYTPGLIPRTEKLERSIAESARFRATRAAELDRWRAKVWLALVLAAGLIFMAAALGGCTTPGYVKADAIESSVKGIRERHDAWARADQGYAERYGATAEAHRQADLLDTEILWALVEEALGKDPKTGQPKATKAAETGR